MDAFVGGLRGERNTSAHGQQSLIPIKHNTNLCFLELVQCTKPAARVLDESDYVGIEAG